MPADAATTPLIADAFVHVQCAYTSLARLAEFGLFWREPPFFGRLAGHFRHIVIVTYGDERDLPLAEMLRPTSPGSTLTVVHAGGEADPTRFQAGVPARLAGALKRLGAGSAIVHTDQHFGGEVGVGIARACRDAGVRTGLVARGGYHWSWFMARDHGPESVLAARAAQVEGELCRASDVVVGSTRRMVEDLAYRHGLPNDRFHLIPNFVLEAGEGASAGAEKREARMLLSAGRFEPQKRQDLLIRAVAIASQERPGVHLALYGQGSLETSLRALAQDVRAPVEFRARVPHEEILREMRRCAAYIQTAAFEGHPKTIIEALSVGAPTIVTRGPGVDEEITPGVSGIIAPDDPRAIADAIIDLLDHPERAALLGRNAAADIRCRLSLDAVFPRYLRAWTAAMRSAGAGCGAPAAGVRWDQELLEHPAPGAAAIFAGSIGAYARRLGPAERRLFLDELAARMEAFSLPAESPPPRAAPVSTSSVSAADAAGTAPG